MRKWGIIISAFYTLIVLSLLVPAAVLLVGPWEWWGSFWKGIVATYREWLVWFSIVIVLGGQAILLFLSVETSQKRLKPRAHILLSCSIAAILIALLTVAVMGSLGVAARGDKFGEGSSLHPFVFFGIAWLFWGILFYFFLRGSSTVVNSIMPWLLRGSVLELLVVVPCHVIVRRRHDCSAPAVTSFGIASGIAILLLSFCPGVLFLYKKRLEGYQLRSSV
jgi:hypothetical protein